MMEVKKEEKNMKEKNMKEKNMKEKENMKEKNVKKKTDVVNYVKISKQYLIAQMMAYHILELLVVQNFALVI